MTETENHETLPVEPVITEVQPAPGADEKPPEPAPDAEVPPETTEQQEARKQSKFQRRLDRQKAARVAAETETRLLREQLTKLEAQIKPQQGEPKQEDFNDFAEYQRALSKYDAAQMLDEKLKSEREVQSGREKQAREATRNAEVAEAWAEREKSFQAATKDYLDVVNPFLETEIDALSQNARIAIAESPVGPALLFYLASNPDEADRIAELSAVRQIAELGKLETKVTMPARKTTSAPAPANILSGARTVSHDIEKMSQEEYEAHRKTQGARWAR
ncbi:MAG: hypothetical protein DDT20_01894 [Firmicutes bacterium]|nr:hypothetical protein [Bacillota bacterium]